MFFFFCPYIFLNFGANLSLSVLIKMVPIQIISYKKRKEDEHKVYINFPHFILEKK